MSILDRREPKVPLPNAWSRTTKSAILHALALAHFVLTHVRGWCADSPLMRVRLGTLRMKPTSDDAASRNASAARNLKLFLRDPQRLVRRLGGLPRCLRRLRRRPRRVRRVERATRARIRMLDGNEPLRGARRGPLAQRRAACYLNSEVDPWVEPSASDRSVATDRRATRPAGGRGAARVAARAAAPHCSPCRRRSGRSATARPRAPRGSRSPCT